MPVLSFVRVTVQRGDAGLQCDSRCSKRSCASPWKSGAARECQRSLEHSLLTKCSEVLLYVLRTETTESGQYCRTTVP